MIYQSKQYTSNRNIGKVRARKAFAWLPVLLLDGRKVWLQWYWFHEQAVSCWRYFDTIELQIGKWTPVPGSAWDTPDPQWLGLKAINEDCNPNK